MVDGGWLTSIGYAKYVKFWLWAGKRLIKISAGLSYAPRTTSWPYAHFIRQQAEAATAVDGGDADVVGLGGVEACDGDAS